MNEFFTVGQIVNTHGIKGEVKVIPYTEDVNNFKRYGQLRIDGKEWRKIQSVKFQKDRVILKLEGIDDMNTAELYKQKYLEVPRAEEPELEEGEYYAVDLVGCMVKDTNGKELGRVFDIISTKNNDVCWIKEPKQLLIPVLDDIVLDIDLDNETITIAPVGDWQDED